MKDGHKAADIVSFSFAGVVSQESVCVALTYASLNNIPIIVADIQNAYLQAPSSEKHYVVLKDEFGEEHRG